jgi:hypothetical protein
MLAATGRIRTPVESVPYTLMYWKYWVIRKMKPKREKNATVTAPLAALKAGIRNRPTSTIGWSLRRSTTTKAAPRSRVPANPARLRAEAHPAWGASMMVNTRRPMAADEVTSPSGSSREASGWRDSGTITTVITAATTATGTRAKKIEPYQKWARSRPPVTGPTATPSPVTAPHTPMAFTRSLRSG